MSGLDLAWARDEDRVVVVGDGGAQAVILEKADAAAWEWWADGHTLEDAVDRAARCWMVDRNEVRRRLLSVVEQFGPEQDDMTDGRS